MQRLHRKRPDEDSDPPPLILLDGLPRAGDEGVNRGVVTNAATCPSCQPRALNLPGAAVDQFHHPEGRRRGAASDPLVTN